MISFLIAFFVLIVGYIFYGAFVEKILCPSDTPTPAQTKADGIDYVPLSAPRAFLVQLLNIAGLGPIFGALSGALWGPCVYLWIVLGTIFAGGVHDFLSGMMSVRNGGATISELTGVYLGRGMQNVMRVFSVVLLLLIGVVFMVGPAALIAALTPRVLNVQFWTVVILVYYFLATLMPIDKVIGRLYPIFGVCLILMAVGLIVATFLHSGERPMIELTLSNMYPAAVGLKKTIWPFMFVTVACGAISGFHATQSPIVARCITTEKNGRVIFYGSMVAEGLIALIWAAAGVAFYYNRDGAGLTALLTSGGGNSSTVYTMCTELLGKVGAVIALIGVIACPITSGDTAFRSARMTLCDWLHIDQKNMAKRLAVCVPLLLTGYLISFVDYQIVWRYFSWANQALATIVLWAGGVYLVSMQRTKRYCWIAIIPAVFMTAVAVSYLLYAPECCKLERATHGLAVSSAIGIVSAVVLLALFVRRYLQRAR